MLLVRCREWVLLFLNDFAAFAPKSVPCDGLATTVCLASDEGQAAYEGVVSGWLGLGGVLRQGGFEVGGGVVVSAGRFLLRLVEDLLQFVSYVVADTTSISPLLDEFELFGVE